MYEYASCVRLHTRRSAFADIGLSGPRSPRTLAGSALDLLLPVTSVVCLSLFTPQLDSRPLEESNSVHEFHLGWITETMEDMICRDMAVHP